MGRFAVGSGEDGELEERVGGGGEGEVVAYVGAAGADYEDVAEGLGGHGCRAMRGVENVSV